MGTKLIGAVLAVGLIGCSEPPSCQDAITHYYAVGCTFVNITTTPPTPYSLNESITSCKEVNAVVPDRCQGEFDDYVSCLNGVESSARCTDCTDEQDRLFGCD